LTDTLTAHWPLFLIGAAVVVILLWWLLIASRRTRVSVERRDTLDEGAAPAARNQALIDTPPVAAGTVVPPMTPDAIGGAGVAVAATAQEARIVAAEHGGDDLTRIKGLGPKLAATLNDLGVTGFAQIAAWTDADIDRIDGQLGRFQGRIRRDDWVEQARLLAAGDAAAFQSKFGAV
jgi:predicted flap endonuclease-1-like 5' DNA nuclease